jgi:formylglycine-generating enzyme required for sulfatase activity/energy-coupling factor transporter ATP-binding protein EcfA2
MFGREYRLPTEAEWEAAARGQSPLSLSRRGVEGEGETRIYPWGNDWDAGKANTIEGRVLKPSPVGAYTAAGNRSPCGMEDAVGNVWNWTSTLYLDYPYANDEAHENPEAEGERVVRGGAWSSNRRGARCAYRNRYVPDDFSDGLGFRVVSHDSPVRRRQSLRFTEPGEAQLERQRCPSLAEPAHHSPVGRQIAYVGQPNIPPLRPPLVAGPVYRPCLRTGRVKVGAGAITIRAMAKKKTTRKTEPIQTGGVRAGRDVNVKRDLVGRDQFNVSITLNMGAFEPSPDLAALSAAYRDHLRRNYRALDFKGIPQLRSLPAELQLEDVYVPLLARPELPAGETWERRVAGRQLNRGAVPEEALAELSRTSAAPVRVEEALAEKKLVVVLGDPGAGKSTLLKHLTLRLATEAEAPLPILVPLNAFARQVHTHNLESYLAEYFRTRAAGVAALGPLFANALAQGRAVVLLDGLDEVQSDRAFVVGKVEAFAREAAARGNRVVVTSRIVGYNDAPLNPAEWALYTLLDFDPEAIERFVKQWCPAFEKSTLGDTPEAALAAQKEEAGLLEAIRTNPGVERLASNPLLLTILALLKRQGVDLPKSRIRLYDRYLETLIESWNKARALDKSAGGPSLDYAEALSVLGPLALHIRETNPTSGLIPEAELQRWLTAHFGGPEWGLRPGPAAERGREFLDGVRRYSNLLLERGERQFGFIHLTFEEALAAYGLVSAGQLDRRQSLDYIERHFTDPAWRETLLLAVGVWGILNRQPLVAGEVVRGMLSLKCAPEHAGQNVLLAGACLEDVGEAGLGRAAAQAVIAALWAAALDRSLPPAVQRDAGFSLGRAGWAPDDLDAFINIPAGPFLYGEMKQRLTIDQPFAIGKYPVTNRQYGQFVEAGGYEDRDLWSDEGWAWRTRTYDSKAPKEYENWLERRPPEKRHEPFDWHDAKWNNPLAPVVGISWFEAEAYSNWASRESNRPIRLPTEEEWERAALTCLRN